MYQFPPVLAVGLVLCAMGPIVVASIVGPSFIFANGFE